MKWRMEEGANEKSERRKMVRERMGQWRKEMGDGNQTVDAARNREYHANCLPVWTFFTTETHEIWEKTEGLRRKFKGTQRERERQGRGRGHTVGTHTSGQAHRCDQTRGYWMQEGRREGKLRDRMGEKWVTYLMV